MNSIQILRKRLISSKRGCKEKSRLKETFPGTGLSRNARLQKSLSASGRMGKRGPNQDHLNLNGCVERS